MRKLLSVSAFVWLLVSLTSACLYEDKTVKTNSNDSRIVNSDITIGDNSIENEFSKFVGDFTKGFVKEMSAKLGLLPLTATTQRNAFEFRHWVNVDMRGAQKLLNIHSNGAETRAMFYHFQRTKKKPIIFDKEAPAGPKSGWKTLLSEVSHQLNTPKPLILDPKFELSRDESVICVEVIENGQYHFVFYGEHTSFEDGLRLINLCEYLSKEFGVDLECKA